jgi:hypothetical protein
MAKARTTVELLIAEVRRLSALATPGPWFAKGEGICCGVYQGAPGAQGVSIDLQDPTWNDAQFIAAARAMLPLLADHATALLAQVETYRKQASKGGKVAAKNMTKAQRKTRAKTAANARWHKGE